MSITRAYAPATVANLGVGFDILGLALESPGDTVTAEWRDEPGVVILGITGDGGKLPTAPEKNTASVAANSVLKLAGERRGVGLHVAKDLPLASGLGSSAASAVAAAVAVNALLDEPMPLGDLLPACLDGEAVASGYHADNVAPCLFGGITLVNGTQLVGQIPIPSRMHLALVTPDVEVPTALARAALPQQVSLKTMVAQTAAVGRLMQALYRDDVEAIAAAMEADSVIEPARAHLMPHLADIRQTAKANGALALVISGAGPTLCAVCDAADVAARVAEAMCAAYTAFGLKSVARHTPISARGACVI